ncbi:MAG: aminopeptidase, partial [Bdellovibrio sp.]|nr:aminopeptidase [Bdellovibrio sp.]
MNSKPGTLPFKQAYLHILFSVVAVFAAPNLAFANAEMCAQVFSSPVEILGRLRTTFEHNDRYSHALKKNLAVKDQCNLGTCHLHAWVSEIERAYAQRTHTDLKLSTEYLSAMHWMQRAFDTLHSADDKAAVSLGAASRASRQAILEYGLMPEGAWSLGNDFMKAPTATRIQEYLRNIIGRAKWQRARSFDTDKQREVIIEAEKEIKEVFASVFAGMPQRFEHQGLDYSPREFARLVFSDLFRPVDSMFVAPANKPRTEVQIHGVNKTVYTTPENIGATILELIKEGQDVYLMYDHNGHFVDSATGIMSISAFNVPKSALPLSREQRDFYATQDQRPLGAGNHAVHVVGVDVDPHTGAIIKLLVKNSWGTKVGRNGYFDMYWDYFVEFV